jgi:GT2 family glycosyltransferase
LEQEVPEFEIVVVDQSDEEPARLSEIAQTQPRVNVLHLKDAGTCRARNAGIRVARGEVIVFLDDDAVPTTSGFLAAHASAYRNPDVAGVAGRVIERRDARAMRGPLLAVSPFGAVHPNASGRIRKFVDHARGGNMSFRRSWVARVGAFDERFRGNAMREETDYSLRVREAGGRILFVPEAEVEHLQHPSGGSRGYGRLRWYEDFFFNEALFFGKHFPLWKFPVFLARKLRPIVACGLYYGRLAPRAVTAPWREFAAGLRAARQPL